MKEKINPDTSALLKRLESLPKTPKDPSKVDFEAVLGKVQKAASFYKRVSKVDIKKLNKPFTI